MRESSAECSPAQVNAEREQWLRVSDPMPRHQSTSCSPNEHEGHRARGEERPERDVLAPAPAPERDQHHADHRAVQESREQPAEHVRPAQPAEEHPEDERQPHVAEAHAARRDEVQDEEERERRQPRRAAQRPNDVQSCPISAANASRITLANPTGYTMRFGMMKCSRSIAEIAISAAVSTRNAGSAHECEYRAPTAANSTPVRISISG